MFEIKNTLSFNKDELTVENKYDYVTRTSQNQGILQTTGFVNNENINEAGCWSLGLLQMDFFYRHKSWYAGQFVRKIIPKFNLTTSSILFFTILLNKQKEKLLSVLVRNVDVVFKNSKIQLPTKNNKIDFEFMENFIAEIEAQKIARLDAYLLENDLKEYRLSKEEEEVLRDFESGKISWDTFNLEELFGKSTRGKRLKSDDRISGDLPFVTAGETDEGVSAFIGNSVTIFPKNTTTIDMFGSAKYRNYEYGGDDHIAVIPTQNLAKHASIFVTTAIHKSAYTGDFNYGRNFYAKDADELNISLPTKNNQPDYTLMQTLISAIQKLVIKDVVLYLDKKLVSK